MPPGSLPVLVRVLLTRSIGGPRLSPGVAEGTLGSVCVLLPSTPHVLALGSPWGFLNPSKPDGPESLRAPHQLLVCPTSVPALTPSPVVSQGPCPWSSADGAAPTACCPPAPWPLPRLGPICPICRCSSERAPCFSLSCTGRCSAAAGVSFLETRPSSPVPEPPAEPPQVLQARPWLLSLGCCTLAVAASGLGLHLPSA